MSTGLKAHRPEVVSFILADMGHVSVARTAVQVASVHHARYSCQPTVRLKERNVDHIVMDADAAGWTAAAVGRRGLAYSGGFALDAEVLD